MPEAVKTERLAALQLVLARQRRDFNSGCVGRILPVLLEKAGPARGAARRAQPLSAECPHHGGRGPDSARSFQL